MWRFLSPPNPLLASICCFFCKTDYEFFPAPYARIYRYSICKISNILHDKENRGIKEKKYLKIVRDQDDLMCSCTRFRKLFPTHFWYFFSVQEKMICNIQWKIVFWQQAWTAATQLTSQEPFCVPSNAFLAGNTREFNVQYTKGGSDLHSQKVRERLILSLIKLDVLSCTLPTMWFLAVLVPYNLLKSLKIKKKMLSYWKI